MKLIRIKRYISLTIIPFVLASVFSTPCFAASSDSDSGKMHILSYVSLTVDSDMEDGMAIGDETIDVKVRSGSHIDVSGYEITDFGKKSDNVTNNSDDDDDDDDTNDGTWHNNDEPILSITLKSNGDDYRLKLTSENIHVNGTADPKVDSVSGSGSEVTVKVKMQSLLSGSASLQDIKIDGQAQELLFGYTPDTVYYEIRIYKNNYYVGDYKTEKGQNSFSFAPYITSGDSYTFSVRKFNLDNNTHSNWYKITKTFTADSDYISETNKSRTDTAYNNPYVNSADGKWQQNAYGWWWQDSTGTYPANAWRYINKLWYYFDTNGYMVTGWKNINNHWYYFNPSIGYMQTGWILANNAWYYTDLSNGTMQTGWQAINGKMYYFAADGKMLANTTTPDGYRVNANGEMVVDSQIIGGDGTHKKWGGSVTEKDIISMQ